MKKPILFIDFDGTICHSKFWRSLAPEEYEKVQCLLFRGDVAFVDDWMRGKYSSEEANKLVAEAIGLPYEQVWETFVNDCKTMMVDIETLDRISSLRNKYRVVLVTGNMDCFSRFTKPALNLENYFDEIINSYEVGKLKTDNEGEFFKEYASQYDTPLEECYVIDDSEKVCKIFSNLGGKVFRVTSENDIMKHLKQLRLVLQV